VGIGVGEEMAARSEREIDVVALSLAVAHISHISLTTLATLTYTMLSTLVTQLQDEQHAPSVVNLKVSISISISTYLSKEERFSHSSQSIRWGCLKYISATLDEIRLFAMALSRNSTVSSLTIWANNNGDEFCKHLAAGLSTNTTLTDLDLSVRLARYRHETPALEL